MRREPRLFGLALIAIAILCVHYLAGIAEWHTNPYDDDIAYLSFVKKLEDTGSFPEPFSFRRLAALGGQTLFVALTSLRAAPNQAHTFDRSISVLMLALLVVGHRVGRRRPTMLFLIGAAVIVPTLPLVAINTAACYSAVAFFVALFRTVVWAEDKPRGPWQPALPLALIGATVCTLRQNFLPIPVIFLGVTYLARDRALRSTTRTVLSRLAEPLWTAGFSILALAPWLIAAFISNRTFLYPFMLGTFNKALVLTSSDSTFFHELRLFIWTLLDGVPLPTIGIFVLAAVFLPERGARKPVLAFLIAAGAGFVLLVHALSQGDAGNLGRYAWSFVVAFVVMVLLSAGLARWSSGSLNRAQVTAAIACVGLLVQLVRSGEQLSRFYNRALRNIDDAAAEADRSFSTRRAQRDHYAALQEQVPVGERLAVLLDEPHWLDFKRNPIWNLDMPGYSSLAPGMPFFNGSEKLEAYFKTINVRYLAFVRADQSSHHYRRDYWMLLLVDEMEVWRDFAPYIIDMLDNLTAIGNRHRHLFDAEGMVVVDLESPAAPGQSSLSIKTLPPPPPKASASSTPQTPHQGVSP